ncbi:MAG: dihydroorotase [Ekhidna sp.]
MRLLLKNARFIDGSSSSKVDFNDVLVRDGIIESLHGGDGDIEIDLNGKILTPGWFDLNANFNDPGQEDKEDVFTGSNVASFGGFTDVNLSPSTVPIIESKSHVSYLLKKAIDSVDIHVTAALSEGTSGENITEILDLHSAGALSFSEGDKTIWNTELMIRALQYTSNISVPIIQCANDRDLSFNTHMHEGFKSTELGLRGEPSLSEELIIKRDLDLLKYSGGKLHFSAISSAKSVDLIRKAKMENLDVTCDVSIHHLLFTDSNVSDFNTIFKVKPPYRLDSDRKALIAGVKEGVVDAICSLHRPQDQESKQLEFDLAEFGNISLQTFYPSLLSIAKEIPFEILLDKVTNGPRKILGLEELKLEVGKPAKMTILDPEAEWTLNSTTNLSKSENSPFWNKRLKGKVFGTVNLNTHLIH